MEQKAVAVIGGGYGDEGKGLMTDYWVSKMNEPIVIRFNGGCQAGHTVETPDGKRNVFSHFGSGTFLHAPTFLSKYFVVNPRIFRQEHSEFVIRYGFAPIVYVDAQCLTTTPVEMLINQQLETQRSLNKHGSVGVGFGETFERVKRYHKKMKIWYVCNVSTNSLRQDMEELIDEYLPSRLDMQTLDNDFKRLIKNEKLIDDFIDDVEYFKEHTGILTNDNQVKNRVFNGDVVFEGAQGLEIDQDYGVFPYVTRSNCGMRNVTELVNKYGMPFDNVLVNYVTRAYKTRHGAGPLPLEFCETELPYEDKTNVHNEWQGTLRWGEFNYNAYRSITDKDFALYANDHNPYYKVKRIDTVTCMDQMDQIGHNDYENFKYENFKYDWNRNHTHKTLHSYGPTRENIFHQFHQE